MVATLQLMGAFRIGAQKTISDRAKMVEEAVQLARESDAVVLVVGLTPDHSEEGCKCACEIVLICQSIGQT